MFNQTKSSFAVQRSRAHHKLLSTRAINDEFFKVDVVLQLAASCIRVFAGLPIGANDCCACAEHKQQALYNLLQAWLLINDQEAIGHWVHSWSFFNVNCISDVCRLLNGMILLEERICYEGVTLPTIKSVRMFVKTIKSKASGSEGHNLQLLTNSMKSAIREKQLNQPKKRCGLCHSTTTPLMKTKCCNNWICDTEDQYMPGSYERKGQCARNHASQTICGFHYTENHSGDWKTCQECEESFHPYDYAVKATNLKRHFFKYNFDDNVRRDINPHDVPLPKCDVCGDDVDSAEENTRTLTLRTIMGGGKVLCPDHGGGFGLVPLGQT